MLYLKGGGITTDTVIASDRDNCHTNGQLIKEDWLKKGYYQYQLSGEDNIKIDDEIVIDKSSKQLTGMKVFRKVPIEQAEYYCLAVERR